MSNLLLQALVCSIICLPLLVSEGDLVVTGRAVVAGGVIESSQHTPIKLLKIH